MDITETVTETKEKVVGYKCDLCRTETRTGYGPYRGKISINYEDGCDGHYSKWADLCMQCTDKVFKFIQERGGQINSDY
jgi:hypothetical protein